MLRLADRAQSGPNAIREMFGVAGGLNKTRAAEGLDPLISLGIGAPHMYSSQLSFNWNLMLFQSFESSHRGCISKLGQREEGIA